MTPLAPPVPTPMPENVSHVGYYTPEAFSPGFTSNNNNKNNNNSDNNYAYNSITITYRCFPESSQRGHRDATGGEQWRSSRQEQQEEEMHRSYMQEQEQLERRHRQERVSRDQRQSQELKEEERRNLQEREELEKRHRQERDWLERSNRG